MQKTKTAKTALIGETIIVSRAANRCLEGKSGEVVDETKNTIKIRTKDGVETLIKDQIKIMNDQEDIEGKQLVGRIEERIKR